MLLARAHPYHIDIGLSVSGLANHIASLTRVWSVRFRIQMAIPALYVPILYLLLNRLKPNSFPLIIYHYLEKFNRFISCWASILLPILVMVFKLSISYH